MENQDQQQFNQIVKEPLNIWLVIIIAIVVTAVVVGGGVYFWQKRVIDSNNSSYQLLQNQINDLQTQLTESQTEQANNQLPESSDSTDNLQTYTNSQLGFEFKYPQDWYISQYENLDNNIKRITVSNTNLEVSKANMPIDFKRVWIAYDNSIETNQSIEDELKSGKSSEGSVVDKSVINNKDILINLYTYNTIGGIGAKAFWSKSNSERYSAIIATEIGKSNQDQELEILKEILTTFKFIK